MANLQVMGESLTARDVVILLKTGYLFVFIITSRTDSIGYISYQCGECPIEPSSKNHCRLRDQVVNDRREHVSFCVSDGGIIKVHAIWK